VEKLRCVIVEDEIPAADELKYIISQYDFIEIIAIAYDGEGGLNLIKKTNPDAVFMDINMPMQNGIELANNVKKFNRDINIIFVTAYEEYAVKAFEVDALDYILKPFDPQRIDKTVQRLLSKFKAKNMDEIKLPEVIKDILNKLDKEKSYIKRIPCELQGKIVLIDLDEVYYCYIDVDKTYVKVKNKKYVTNYTLREIENKTDFFRAHRSYLINLDKIKELFSWFNGTYKIILSDDDHSEIPISRNNVKKLKELIGI
jgi:two-component system, LytTR family, response regulator LytT